MKVFGSYGPFYDSHEAERSHQFIRWAVLAKLLRMRSIPRISVNQSGLRRRWSLLRGRELGQANFARWRYSRWVNVPRESEPARVANHLFRPAVLHEEGVAPGLKPYEQHESVFGVDYQIKQGAWPLKRAGIVVVWIM